MAIVYEHLRNDTNEVFYVGIGKTEKRAYRKDNRTQYWKRIVEKVGYTVNIIYKDIEHQEAKKIEILLIEKYGRKDLGTGNLVNLTDGGEGTLGSIKSEETKQKMSEKQKGEKNHFFGKTHLEEAKQKISEASKGKMPMLGKKHSDKAKEKISLGQRNRKNVKGYYFDKEKNKFRTIMQIRGKRKHFGSFDTPGEAAEAYQKARLIYFV